ncbi:MAG: hypothetical protein O6944_01965 [Gammaproteobacteria bacterium]|nr:hypothetical protein [Gammaproteobacteria bacterium]
MKTLSTTKRILAIIAAMMLFAAPTVADVKDRMVERRAIVAAVWGMPIVNFQAMRDGLKQGAGERHAHKQPIYPEDAGWRLNLWNGANRPPQSSRETTQNFQATPRLP